MIWWLVAAGAAVGLAVSVGRTWWRERQLTERVRDEEWAQTLAAAEARGWPPYTMLLPGLRWSRRDELAWREVYLRTAPHCHLLVNRDGREEWMYVQPEEEQR